jgi:hypothetical protein
VAKSTISTILNMKHHVRTYYGDSTTYYGGDKWAQKPHGCGQGNGYGPALWACISSPLLHLLRQHGYGTKLCQPITGRSLHTAAFAFVDDTDLIQTEDIAVSIISNATSSLSHLFKSTQGAVNTWSSLLNVTGGDLEPSKTFCVPIVHKWQGTKKVLLPNTPDTLQIYLRNANGKKELIEKKDPNQAFFTLGIWQSPSGDETVQKDFLIEHIRKWEHRTSTHKLTWAQARIASQATLGKTLSYPLLATAFNEKECKTLQKQFLSTMLGKVGVVRTAPALLACAPTQLGGFGLLSFEIDQLISHIGMILQHGPNNESITGSLLRTSFEYLAIEMGFQGDPLSLIPQPYVTQQTWTNQILCALRKHNVQIVSDFGRLMPWTRNDVFIMEEVAKQTNSPSTVAIINKVRLYLQVTTLSDMISADGTIFDVNLLKGERSTSNPNPSFYRYCWPKMDPPLESGKRIVVPKHMQYFQHFPGDTIHSTISTDTLD